MEKRDIKKLLDRKADAYNRPSFIPFDPISVPHRYTRKADIEIAGFFAAMFAWGNRTTIIRKSNELMERMDHAPQQFILQHQEKDLKKLLDFKHRTFNATDLLCFVDFLHRHYRQHPSLESAFTRHGPEMEHMLTGFHEYFFSGEDVPPRTRKHIASPARGSTCKRLNMFLRWMVRQDDRGVDFGIWTAIRPSALICPIDLHVARVARRLGILRRKQTDWLAALELTEYLRTLDPDDPARYDFALFGLGALEEEMDQLN